ncbi:hypothetical protein RclHR1_13130005 [Rhizophagus clarus]|uniref:AAA family ATPase n=1 Tax=Rhizophagus clarus TaxID=94130 RepID=A0A2Z6QLR0_9GLOM|nr:hypothetical protein RclHR1_13130005 [Rhizophagus clarus]GET03310.1 AAA family ATPase [Rhizophagus clarus]
MPAKTSMICYLHNFTEWLIQEFTVKEITAVARLDDKDLTKIVYLRVKVFIPVDQNILCQIEDFSNGQVVFLKEKFVSCASWYSVNATSIKTIDPLFSNNMFKPKTNFLLSVCLQPGACVMYLNNFLISYGTCNGTIGVVTDVNLTEEYARIAFSVRGSIIDIDIYKQTHYFNINDTNCNHTQFPLQNCFVLTIYKTQGLTLPRVCLALDGNIFLSGQAYIALNKCSS